MPSQTWDSIYADPLKDTRRWHAELSRTIWSGDTDALRRAIWSGDTSAPGQPADPNGTAGRDDLNPGPDTTTPPPAGQEPRVGRPYRGDRAKTKAARRARRLSR